MSQPVIPNSHEEMSRADTGTGETEAERNNRNLSDLLQELRVAGLGVQVLFGFLLAMPFTTVFSTLDPEQHRLYAADLVLAALATARHRLGLRTGGD